MAILLRPGNAGATPPMTTCGCSPTRWLRCPMSRGIGIGKKVLVRVDAGGGTHEFLDYLTPAPGIYGRVRADRGDGRCDRGNPGLGVDPGLRRQRRYPRRHLVAEATGVCDLSTWPPGMRLIVRKERPVRREALLIRTEVKDLRRRSRRGGTVELRAARPGRAASGPDKAGTYQHCQMVRVRRAGRKRSTQGTDVYVPSSCTGSNLADMGRGRCASHRVLVGTSWVG